MAHLNYLPRRTPHGKQTTYRKDSLKKLPDSRPFKLPWGFLFAGPWQHQTRAVPEAGWSFASENGYSSNLFRNRQPSSPQKIPIHDPVRRSKCIISFTCILQGYRSASSRLPARLFDARYSSRKRIHSELKSRHSEVSEDTSPFPSHNASVSDLRRSCVTVHLSKLKLGLCSGSLR